MEHLFSFILMTMTSLGYTEGLLCPIGQRLTRDTLPVDSESLTWSGAAMKCIKRNGIIININDNQAEQTLKDTMKRYSLNKAWIGYSGDIEEISNSKNRSKLYFIIKDVDDGQFRASSHHKDYAPRYARINSQRAWIPWFKRFDQWIQVDLKKTMCIHGIVTQGVWNENWRITVYKLHYSKDGDSFLTLRDNGKEELSANEYYSTAVSRNFTKPFSAQFVRLYPQAWNSYPAIRFDLLVSNNSCPTDFTCGKCPAVVKTATEDFKIQNEPCCSKIPYICETWSCDQDQAQSSIVNAGTSQLYADSVINNTTTNSSYADLSNAPTDPIVANSTTLIIGLRIGLIFFMLISIILLVLLIRSYRKQNKFHHPSVSANSDQRDSKKREKDTSIIPNLQNMTEPKDRNSHAVVKTNGQKPETIYSNIDEVTNEAEYEIKDEATYGITDDLKERATGDATYLELYHSSAHRNVYTDVETKVIGERKNESEIPDGVEMIRNEIYSNA